MKSSNTGQYRAVYLTFNTKMQGIYKITNLITGDCYVGQSKNIEKRFIQHRSADTGSRLHEAIKKYGKDNFEYEVIEECSQDILEEREKFYITKIQPYYNCRITRNDIDFRKKVSIGTKKWWDSLPESTQQKIIKNNLTGPKIGHVVTEETREKLRQLNLGKKQSIETIEKRKQAVKKYRENHPQTNEKHKKPVILNEHRIFNSVKECAEFLEVDPSTISSAIRRKNKVKGNNVRYVV